MPSISSFIQKLFRRAKSPTDTNKAQPTIIPRAKHSISRSHLPPSAIKVLYRLRDAGFAAHLVGGSVRDLLVGSVPKDFDIATNAKPEQVYKLFRNCRLIGRRFRLAHIYFGQEIIEVATFRGYGEDDETLRRHSEHGMILRDNVYGSMADDAFRRDFTINALYYNIADFSVIDYTGGMTDLQQKIIRMIGDPVKRYREDPVRMIRAMRLAAKLDFNIHPDTEKPITELTNLLPHVAPSRLFDELLKIYFCGKSERAFQLMHTYGLFSALFPQTEACLEIAENNSTKKLLEQTMSNADARVAENKSLSPAFLFVALLWHPLQTQLIENQNKGMHLFPALAAAMDKVLREQTRITALSRRFTTIMREIWVLQYMFPKRNTKRVFKVLNHPRFRASYDFLLLRQQAGEPIQELVGWWNDFQQADDDARNAMIRAMQKQGGERRRRRPRKRKPPEQP